MLVLTRRPMESIIIADEIKITLIRIDGDRVRIGIDAPRDLEIWRQEIQIERNKTCNTPTTKHTNTNQ